MCTCDRCAGGNVPGAPVASTKDKQYHLGPRRGGQRVSSAVASLRATRRPIGSETAALRGRLQTADTLTRSCLHLCNSLPYANRSYYLFILQSVPCNVPLNQLPTNDLICKSGQPTVRRVIITRPALPNQPLLFALHKHGRFGSRHASALAACAPTAAAAVRHAARFPASGRSRGPAPSQRDLCALSFYFRKVPLVNCVVRRALASSRSLCWISDEAPSAPL